jgi:hypothetical protein
VNSTAASPPSVSASGEDVIVVSGAVVSTLNETVAGLASVLPALSVARTENVWLPSASLPEV